MKPDSPVSRRAGLAGVLRGFVIGTAIGGLSVVTGEPPAAAETASPIVRLEVFPTTVELRGQRHYRRLVVTGVDARGEVRDLSREATFSTDQDGVVSTEGAVIRPLADGSTTVTVRAASHAVPVGVTVALEADPVSFHFDVLPALSKQGCSSGECHGSPLGKGSFRLSLRAFNPQLDAFTLVDEEPGRRTAPGSPDASLLLRKPTQRVPHQGGLRLHSDDPAHGILRKWIAARCPTDHRDGRQVTSLEVFPRSGRVLRDPVHEQQFSVVARFLDGSMRDVTELVVFSVSDPQVADISVTGLLTGYDRGEVAVVVRYLEFIESTYVTFVRDMPGFAWNVPPAKNYIDTLVEAKVRQLQFLPAPSASDAEFLRRVHLDLTGVLPDPGSVQSFLASEVEDKRARLIDRLLDSPLYAKFWALKWGDLLRVSERAMGTVAARKYHSWIESSLAENVPYDSFTAALLLSSGSNLHTPPANFYRTTADANDAMETTAQVFLGTRMQCAKCHNHPFERWTQDNYYGLVSFFNAVKRKRTNRREEFLIWTEPGPLPIHPGTGKEASPWVPGDVEIGLDNVRDARRPFVDWLRHDESLLMARVEVNRIWAHLFGRGIVEPFDDFRDSNPPANAQLLKALAADFVESGYDRKHLVRTILNSRTYQRSSAASELNRADRKYFSRYLPRRLGAEQLLDAVGHLLGVGEKFRAVPPGTRATHLPVPELAGSDFLKIFGQPARQSVCECERADESSLPQALQLFNGPLVHQKLGDETNRFRRLLKNGSEETEIVTELYLAGFSRNPTPTELQTATTYIARSDDRAAAFEDLCWALLNSNEFLFQH